MNSGWLYGKKTQKKTKVEKNTTSKTKNGDNLFNCPDFFLFFGRTGYYFIFKTRPDSGQA